MTVGKAGPIASGLLALGLLACGKNETVTKPGNNAQILIQLRAATIPNALAGTDPVGSFYLQLRTDTPAQSVTATIPWSEGQATVDTPQPFSNLSPSPSARLKVWGVDTHGAMVSVGRSAVFNLPSQGTVQVPVFLGNIDAFSAGPASALLQSVGGAAVSLGDGRVLLVGGEAAGVGVSAAIYDHRDGSVTLVDDAPTVLFPAVAALDGGSVLVAGGFTVSERAGAPEDPLDDLGAPSDQLWLFSDGGFSLLSLQLPNGGVGAAQAAWFDAAREVLVMGGISASDGGSATAQISAISFSGGTPSLRPAAGALSQPRAFASATALRDISPQNVLVVGGVGGLGEASLASADVVAVDGSGNVSVLPALGMSGQGASGSLGEGRVNAAVAAMPGGVVFIYGGSDGGWGSGAPWANPDSMVFSPLLSDPGGFLPIAMSTPTLVDARAGAVAAPLPDGTVLLAGGVGSGDGQRFTAMAGQNLGQSGITSFQGGLTSLPGNLARLGGIATVLRDGAVLLTGGLSSLDGGAETAAEIFVPCADADDPCPP